MQFNQQRRQQFLGEKHYREQLIFWDEVIDGQRENLRKPEGKDRGWHCGLMRGIADELFIKLALKYSAGESIDPLPHDLEQVVAAYERYGEMLWRNSQDRNDLVFLFSDLDEYCQLLQLVGLCYLLHRRDLLPRLADLQDGDKGSNGGADTIFEELMIPVFGAERRYQTDHACQVRPYENLFYALTEREPAAQLKELDLFLKHWYKDLAGTGWHDSHKPDEHGNQGGYYGYWSFEAGAAVLLLGIEDDSSLHKYLYYPKDLVAWARAHDDLSETDASADSSLRCEAGQPCPRAGYWFTPAQTGSRRRFRQGETMPDLQSAWGATIWQWDRVQDSESA